MLQRDPKIIVRGTVMYRDTVSYPEWFLVENKIPNST